MPSPKQWEQAFSYSLVHLAFQKSKLAYNDPCVARVDSKPISGIWNHTAVCTLDVSAISLLLLWWVERPRRPDLQRGSEDDRYIQGYKLFQHYSK